MKSARIGNDKLAELTALLVSLLFSLVFLASFALLYEPEPVHVVTSGPTFSPTLPAEVAQVEKPPDSNDKFRIVPDNFAGVDFGNWQYGRYKFGGRDLDITLAHGRCELGKEKGGETFSLIGVVYTDLTGDGKPEAIVNLSHVQCGGSCDGGSDLFFIYQSSDKGLRTIWEYETGSMAYGCGLKSVTITNKQIVVEMFGQCWGPVSSFTTSGKFMVRDVTRSVFHFNGKRFVKSSTEVTAAPVRDLRSYTPELHIQ